MSVWAEEIAAMALVEARLWLGTPYLHQASCQGAGCDCLGLIRGIWRRLYGGEPQQVPPYSADWAASDPAERLWAAARLWLVAADDAPARAGQILLFRMQARGPAQHLGLLSALQPAHFIHAYSGHAVTESPLSSPWARRVVARFAFP